MGASRVNHVSVSGTDLAVSTEFYERLLGAQVIASPDFGFPVQWMALGDTQLHIFQSDVEPTIQHHFGVEVDLDVLVAAYRLGAERGILEGETFGGHLIGLPGDVVQLYLRDPAGNLVEIDAAGKDRLPEDMRAQLKQLWDFHPHTDEQLSARLFVPE